MRRTIGTGKREGRGQQVKTFKAMCPQPNATWDTSYIAKVYLEASSGEFRVYLPEHIAAQMGDPTIFERREASVFGGALAFNPNGGCLYAPTLDAIVDGVPALFRRYHSSLTRTNGVKKLVFKFSANGGHLGLIRRSQGNDISFCGSPALYVSYEVLEEVGGLLYERHVHHDSWVSRDLPASQKTDTMHYRGKLSDFERKDSSSVLMDWTQEREDFFKSITERLGKLIDTMDEFTAAAKKDPAAAFAQFAGLAALPAPAPPVPRERRRIQR